MDVQLVSPVEKAVVRFVPLVPVTLNPVPQPAMVFVPDASPVIPELAQFIPPSNDRCTVSTSVKATAKTVFPIAAALSTAVTPFMVLAE